MRISKDREQPEGKRTCDSIHPDRRQSIAILPGVLGKITYQHDFASVCRRNRKFGLDWVGTNTGKLIPGEMKVVGTGLVAANDASYAVPKGYVQNIDGSITGPKGGTYTPTGKMDTSGNQIYREGNGGYFTLDAASGRTSVASPGPSATGTGRPTSQQSEVDVGAGLPANSQSQVSYLNGKEVPYGTAGSVRPDWCIGTVCSVEVKNYDVITNTRNLTDNVAQQAIQRAQNLPQGMTQTIVIDIRGQTVTAAQEFAIVQSIVQKSNGLISPKNISFKR